MMPNGIGIGFAESGELVISRKSAIKAVANAVPCASRLCGDDALKLRIVEHWHNFPAAPAP
jgi:hypothetical protein